jgi:hypothetical protein
MHRTRGRSDFSPLIAIRYLGGILEIHSFWIQTGPIHEAIINKIIAKTALFLKDIGVDSADDEAMGPSDVEGIDNLCNALLQGVQRWMVGRDGPDLAGEFWYNGFVQLIQLLRQYVACIALLCRTYDI